MHIHAHTVNGHVLTTDSLGPVAFLCQDNNNNIFISYFKYTSITPPANSKANQGRCLLSFYCYSAYPWLPLIKPPLISYGGFMKLDDVHLQEYLLDVFCY